MNSYKIIRVEVKALNKQLVLIGIVFILVCVGLSGCEGNKLFWGDEDLIVGVWETEQEPLDFEYSRSYHFNKHYLTVYCFDGVNYPYKLEDKKLIITIPHNSSFSNGAFVYQYSFKNTETLSLLEIHSENQTPVIYKLKSG